MNIKVAAHTVTHLPNYKRYLLKITYFRKKKKKAELLKLIHCSFAVTTILSGDSRESVVEKIHNHLIEIGEQVRDNKIPMEDYLITKVLYLYLWFRAEKSLNTL